MKYLVISDVHGSSLYLETVLQKYQVGVFDGILLLGDTLYHGPRNPLPDGYNCEAVFSSLNKLKDSIIAVKGNCDSEVDQMVLDFEMMSMQKKLEFENLVVHLTHGHHELDMSTLVNGKTNLVLSGHTHIPVASKENELYYGNPGSISLPKGGFDNSYAILTETSFIVHSLKSDKVICSVSW